MAASLFLRLAGAAVILAFAWFVAGPPWRLDRHVDADEQAHLGSLEAMRQGATPFIGPAATSQGPGSQLLTYWYMQRSDGFTIAGLRQAGLLCYAIAIAATGLVALWLIDLPSALLVMVIALACLPPGGFHVAAGNGLDGASGSDSVFRYLGALLVVPGAVLSTARVRRHRLSLTHLMFGVAWGFSAWVEQGNLIATAAATAIALLLVVWTGNVERRQARTVALSMVAGLAIFWVPLLLVYAAAGHAGEFIANYFSWPSERAIPSTENLLTPCLVAVIGILTLWDLPRRRRRAPLSASQLRLLVFVCLLAATYTIALIQRDNGRLIAALLPLPFVLTLAFRDLPSWSAVSWIGRGVVRAAVVAIAIYAYPVAPLLTDLYSGLIKPSLARFRADSPIGAEVQ